MKLENGRRGEKRVLVQVGGRGAKRTSADPVTVLLDTVHQGLWGSSIGRVWP